MGSLTVDDDKEMRGGRGRGGTLEEWIRTPQREAEEGSTERQ